jgi:hypothetical protein
MKEVVAPIGCGVVGLVAAGLVGAILSSIDSMLNSASTIVTFDVYKRYVRPDADDQHLIFFGRVCIVVFIVIAAALTIFTMDPNSKNSFFMQIATHQSKLIAGVVVAFALGMLWKRATGAGAIVAIVAGIAFSYLLPVQYENHLGTSRLTIEDNNTITLDRLKYATGDAVRLHTLGLPPVASPEIIADEKEYFVHIVDAESKAISLHTSAGSATSGTDALAVSEKGKGPQFLYLSSRYGLARQWGPQLAFMHSVFLAAILSFLLHVGVSLCTQHDPDKAQYTWTGLGGHDPQALARSGVALAASLVIYASMGTAMAFEAVSPLVAACVASAWTFAMFLIIALRAIRKAKDGTALEGSTTNLLLEDRFWAGLLAACAIFMIFYFK